MNRVYIGIGSNLGDRLQNLSKALERLEDVCDIVTVSSVYETEPVGFSSPNMFLNMAVAGETALDPSELLEQLKEIEDELGRRRDSHNKDREIDLDILLYEGMIYRNSMVTIPHPEMAHRRFVLVPLAEIAPDAVHPVKNETIQALLEQCPVQSVVVRTKHQLSLIH
ncbi:MAG TPA: 2-amino-4-hydroxy-6-hydroxymethyldihydropteridine diphosphokinase [Bacteroidota bacterium]|nr:2-amino-4-hydroxy-6-hydroxymethyldihydropteridine diphosphokinase [Bacteroidota bacterium]